VASSPHLRGKVCGVEHCIVVACAPCCLLAQVLVGYVFWTVPATDELISGSAWTTMSTESIHSTTTYLSARPSARFSAQRLLTWHPACDSRRDPRSPHRQRLCTTAGVLPKLRPPVFSCRTLVAACSVFCSVNSIALVCLAHSLLVILARSFLLLVM